MGHGKLNQKLDQNTVNNTEESFKSWIPKNDRKIHIIGNRTTHDDILKLYHGKQNKPGHFAHFMSAVPLIFLDFVQSQFLLGKCLISIEL